MVPIKANKSCQYMTFLTTIIINCYQAQMQHPVSCHDCICAAGVAAGFNAPISGVFFAVETVLQAQGSDLRRTSGDTSPGLTIAMVLLASVLAAIVSQAGLGMVPAVKVPDYQLQSALELPLILIFGACCGLVSASFAYSNQVGHTNVGWLDLHSSHSRFSSFKNLIHLDSCT